MRGVAPKRGNDKLSDEFQRSVYSGQDRLGSISRRGNEYIARNRQGRPIGRTNTAGEAIAAASDAAKNAR